jgi:hypothetical protein
MGAAMVVEGVNSDSNDADRADAKAKNWTHVSFSSKVEVFALKGYSLAVGQ